MGANIVESNPDNHELSIYLNKVSNIRREIRTHYEIEQTDKSSPDTHHGLQDP